MRLREFVQRVSWPEGYGYLPIEVFSAGDDAERLCLNRPPIRRRVGWPVDPGRGRPAFLLGGLVETRWP